MNPETDSDTISRKAMGSSKLTASGTSAQTTTARLCSGLANVSSRLSLIVPRSDKSNMPSSAQANKLATKNIAPKLSVITSDKMVKNSCNCMAGKTLRLKATTPKPATFSQKQSQRRLPARPYRTDIHREEFRLLPTRPGAHHRE